MKHSLQAAVWASLLALASSLPADEHGRGGDPYRQRESAADRRQQRGAADGEDVERRDREQYREEYRDRAGTGPEGTPPGIEKRLERGKPAPPGMDKRGGPKRDD